MNPQAVINAGWLDAMIRVMSQLPVGEIKATNREYAAIVRRLRENTPFDQRGGWAAWRQVAEQARIAVNRAKRMERDPANNKAPKLIPDPGEPGNPNRNRADYHVIVVFVDPQTGGQNRQYVVVDDDAGLSHQQVGLSAVLATMDAGSWTASGQSGVIDQSTAVFRQVIILGVTGSI